MKRNFILLIALILLINSFVFAQISGRKPTATREPKGAMDKKPDSPKNSLPKITSLKDFEKIGRTYHQNTPYAMLHAMFVVDRKNGNKIYFVNSQKFRFHKDFLFATGLVSPGSDVYKSAYYDDDRRFIVGTIAWQKTVDKWTWELWEGDLAKEVHIKTAHETINKSFYETVNYKPNSGSQEAACANLKIPIVTQDELNKNQSYLALNTGKAVGRIHIIDKLDDTVEIGDNEILVLKELPENIPPVRGIIVAKPSTPLSHVNILAKGWNIPNVYIKDADKLFKEFDTYWMNLDAKLTNYTIKRAGKLDKTEETPLPREAPANLDVKKVATLKELRKKDSITYGSKSTNLGEMLNAKVANIVVPDGFTVPFYWYDKFMKDNGLAEIVENQEDENDFVHNPRYRKGKLEELRNKIMAGNFDETLKAEIIQKWKTQLGGKPVFVRSSSNSEDLPNFSGAGLYKSVANVKDEEKLIEAVKTTWSSLWSFQAYEARVRNYVDQQTVYMSTLIQIGIDMDRGGVMFTKDPFDAENKNSVYISSVCGHNSKVTGNGGMPEQILVNPRSNAVVLMTFSDVKNTLRFDANGDLKDTNDTCANPKTKRILNDLEARKLAKIALSIRKVFGDKKEQDIEWGMIKDQVYVVQSRPYIDKK
jgi:rifampicin phosphotransferase